MGDSKEIIDIGSIKSVSSKLFLGLILSFFHINLFDLHLDTYLPLIGLCLLITAAWQLRHETKHFKYMFITGSVQLAIMVAGFVISSTKVSKDISTILCFTFVSSIIAIATYCWLFSGIAQLVKRIYNSEKEKKDELEKVMYEKESEESASMRKIIANDVIADKVYNCSYNYLIISIAMLICIFVPFVTIFAISLMIILLILILTRVNRALNTAKQSNTEYKIESLNYKYYLYGISFGILSIAICFTALLYVNTPRPKSNLFQLNNTLHHDQAIKIRDKMLQMNFDPDILNNLPDSEILRYEDVQFIQINHEDMQVDGGILRLSICTASFKECNMRVLLYYNWIKAPHHNYTDVISYSLAEDLVTPNNEVLYSAILSEKSGEKYNTSALESDYDPFYKSMKFRLWGKNHKNQLGYIAFNTLWRSVEPMSINIQMNYIHQNSMFNMPYQDNLNIYKDSGDDFMMLDTSTQKESPIFQQYSFMALIHSDKASALEN